MQLVETKGGEDAFVTENWQVGLCSSLSSYSVSLRMSVCLVKHYWRLPEIETI